MYKFELNEDEIKRYAAWVEIHDKTCRFFHNQGAIGGRTTFCFTITGIGVIVTVRCACDAECDLTDYGCW